MADDADDAALVARARAGDGRAFEALYRRYARPVAAAVADRVHGPEDRADAVQEAFAHAFRHLDQLREPDRFKSWLYSIARNAAAHQGREVARADVTERAEIDPADEGAGPVELAELAELASRVRRAGALLSSRDATALTLAVTFGMGPAELAVALGVTEGNAKVILHRARRRLRAVLELEGILTSP